MKVIRMVKEAPRRPRPQSVPQPAPGLTPHGNGKHLPTLKRRKNCLTLWNF
jgi:hypothetical protein